ncbi:YdcF family protein [Longitalea arenae]|uniref:YdcF family protein n=1 Tax=Longitalea arenae TaxID=2812558 RepID=UPI00196766EC|nr:YdcF family protein [Longitalea arenae]
MKKVFVKIIGCCFLLFLHVSEALALSEEDQILLMKNFPFLYMLEPALQKLHKEPATFISIRKRLASAAQDAKQCQTAACFSGSLQFTPGEIDSIGDALAGLVLGNEKIRKLVHAIKTGGPYPLFAKETDAVFVRKAWQADAKGINYILGIYLEGRAPLYPKIDSISFSKNDPAFRDSVAAGLARLMKDTSSAFFSIPLLLTLEALRLNGRNEAARYEPLFKKENAEAYRRSKKIKWRSYPYSVILVPGLGPEQPDVKLDPNGARRCDSAALRYRAGKAPFIVVSGGHVHPYKTPYCEAVEMKKYLVEVLHIPAAAVIIEPHARHTTTNLRNTSRIVFHFKMPADKPVLIVTDPGQNTYINGAMHNKVIKELGYTPYSAIKKVRANETEYIPSENSCQINSLEPLDP